MIKYFVEIKKWLILITLNFLVTTTIIYLYKEIVLFLFTNIFNNYNSLNSFIFTNVQEILSIYYYLIKFICLQTFNVYIFYNGFGFLALSFYKKEYFFVKSFLKTFWSILFIFSFILANIVMPLSFNFLLSFQKLLKFSFKLNFEPKLNEFFDLYVFLYSMFFNCFQLFMFISLILYYSNVKKNNIKKYWKLLYFCFAALVVLITPEIFSQIVFNLIFIGLFEFMLLWFILKINLN